MSKKADFDNLDLLDEEIPDIEEAISQAIKTLAHVKDENLKQLTELNKKEIRDIAVLLTLSDKFKQIEDRIVFSIGSNIIRDFVYHFLALRISLDRKGRKDILDVVRYANTESYEEKSRIKKLLGGIFH